MEGLVGDIIPQAIQSKDYDLIYSFIANDLIRNVNEKFLIDDTEAPLLYFAIKDASIDLVQLLLARPEIDVNATSITFSTTEQGKKVKKCERTLLNISVENENVEIIQYLISKPGINVNAKNVDCEQYEGFSYTESGEKNSLFIS